MVRKRGSKMSIRCIRQSVRTHCKSKHIIVALEKIFLKSLLQLKSVFNLVSITCELLYHVNSILSIDFPSSDILIFAFETNSWKPFFVGFHNLILRVIKIVTNKLMIFCIKKKVQKIILSRYYQSQLQYVHCFEVLQIWSEKTVEITLGGRCYVVELELSRILISFSNW